MNQRSANLFDLVRFRHRALRLQVENLVNTCSCEDMVAALDSLREAEPPEKRAEVVESDAGIRGAPQYSHQNRLAHTSLCAQGQIPRFPAFGHLQSAGTSASRRQTSQVGFRTTGQKGPKGARRIFPQETRTIAPCSREVPVPGGWTYFAGTRIPLRSSLRDQVWSHDADELAGGDHLGFLPEPREMPLVAGHQVVGAGGIGAFQKLVVVRVLGHLECA